MNLTYAEYVPVFKAVSDETRIKIIDMLSCGQMCACDILVGLSITQSTLSYHMKILSECGLVDAERDGPWMRYKLNQKKIDAVQIFFTDITRQKEDCICQQCKKC